MVPIPTELCLANCEENHYKRFFMSLAWLHPENFSWQMQIWVPVALQASSAFWICSWHLASSFWPGWLPSFPTIILKLSNKYMHLWFFFFFWEMSKWELQKEKITVTSIYPQLSISLVNGLESFFYVCLGSVCVCVCARASMWGFHGADIIKEFKLLWTPECPTVWNFFLIVSSLLDSVKHF